MEHDWKKATLKPAVAAKNSDATNLTCHFKADLKNSNVSNQCVVLGVNS